MNVLGFTVENLTNGAFRKNTLMYAVSLGVAFGITIGVVKIIYGIPIYYLVLPGYIAAFVLTVLSSEEFVNVAWDSAGVTTGPVTVPPGIGDGFGARRCCFSSRRIRHFSHGVHRPYRRRTFTGLYVQWTAKRRQEENDLAAEDILP